MIQITYLQNRYRLTDLEKEQMVVSGAGWGRAVRRGAGMKKRDS